MSPWSPPEKRYPPPKADEPPLHRAARLGDRDAIRALVAGGADVDELFDLQLNARGLPRLATALIVAAGSVDGATADTLRLLVDLGASVGASPSGMSALNLAAGHGDPERVRVLLEAGADPAPDAAPSSRVPLREAVYIDALESVQLLLDAGAPANPSVSAGTGPILAGVSSLAVMSALLDAGADPFAEVRDGRTIVADVARSRKASVAERVAMLRRLVEVGVDLDRAGDMAFTPLADVAMGGNADAVEALLVAGADPHTERNALGTVCFAYANDRDPGTERTVDLLIAAGLDPNDTDERGNSPLHAALSADAFGPQYTESDGINVAAAFALLRHGASIDITYRDTGYRPLHAAAAGGSAVLVEVLLQAGADATERATAGETPLDVARAAGAEDCVRLLEAATPSV